MPGDHWQKLANLRALYAYMWAHPGKKLLFMGQEFAQEQEWSHERSLDWHLLEDRDTPACSRWCATSTASTRPSRRCGRTTSRATGFYWLEPNDAERNVVAFARTSQGLRARRRAASLNLTPVPRTATASGCRGPGRWVEAVNTDSEHYGGSDVGNFGGVEAEPIAWGGQPFSAEITLPPLGGVWLVPEDQD